MQMKAVSLVAITTWFFAAVGASTLARRVVPVPDAAVTHVLIHPILDSTLCLTATGADLTSPQVLSPCDGTNFQIWDVNHVNNAVFQFQNVGTNLVCSLPRHR
ncbi:hypothetical protein B0H19DRAFT_1254148 [Mycena capillaripes]|nr:hypothetical protein B0H19DRAFT_1254148 [Mycena capillaripes]